MEITHNNKTGSLDKYLDGLKRRIPSLATTKSSESKVDLYQEARIFKAELDRFCTAGTFVIEPETRDFVNSIFAWVWRYDAWNKYGLDYKKGLFLYGPIGTGKSTILRGLQGYMRTIKKRDLLADDRMGFYWRSASELTNYYVSSGQERLLQWCDDNLLIDELGREPLPAKYYGNELNVIQFLLQMRYDNRENCVTHITSNLMLSDITPMYGDYISDRFKEMFNIIYWGGKSKR